MNDQPNEKTMQWMKDISDNIEYCSTHINGICPINVLCKVLSRIAIKRRIPMEDVLQVLNKKHQEALEELTTKPD